MLNRVEVGDTIKYTVNSDRVWKVVILETHSSGVLIVDSELQRNKRVIKRASLRVEDVLKYGERWPPDA